MITVHATREQINRLLCKLADRPADYLNNVKLYHIIHATDFGFMKVPPPGTISVSLIEVRGSEYEDKRPCS